MRHHLIHAADRRELVKSLDLWDLADTLDHERVQDAFEVEHIRQNNLAVAARREAKLMGRGNQ
jgi:hypothetical protein